MTVGDKTRFIYFFVPEIVALEQDQQQHHSDVETHHLDIGDYTGDVVDGLPHGRGALEFKVRTNSC